MQNVTLDVKQNGILIEMELEKAIDQENIAAWQSDSDWFYITLYQVTGDSSKLAADKLPEGIRDFQVIISQESTQLGVRLHHPIEYYDITQDETAYQILASLYYPSDLFTALPALQQYDTMEKELGMPKSLRSWMYITGFALTVNGLLTQEQDETNWETKIGLGTLFATYIADKLWPKS